jgi:hypothetical protein
MFVQARRRLLGLCSPPLSQRSAVSPGVFGKLTTKTAGRADRDSCRGRKSLLPVFWRVVMRAIVIEKFGGPDSLVYKDLPEPEPLAGHVVIEVMATYKSGAHPVARLSTL